MTEIICVGDIHVSDHAPVNCHDSYTDDIVDMLVWIAGEAARRGADAVVWAGDIFHHKSPSKNSHALVLKMVGVVREYEKVGIPLWIVTGNHDISNNRIESVREKQPLGVLFEAGARELDGWHPSLPLYGVPWQAEWSETLDEAFEEFRADPPEFVTDRSRTLAVTHASIFPPAIVGNVPYEHLPAEDVARAMGNEGCLYYGHIHDYHGIFEAEGVTFANMGAISRGSLTESNTNRKILVASWTDHSGFEIVQVPHKPADEVFKLEQAAEKKSAEHGISSFLSSVGAAAIEISSTASVISHVKSLGLGTSVENLAIEILEEVDE